MELITQRGIIEGVLKRWEAQYGTGNDEKGYGINKDEIRLKLKALNLKTATAADVDAAIGNSSWTRLDCDECGAAVKEIVVAGQTPDYESSTAGLCINCVAEALELIANPDPEE